MERMQAVLAGGEHDYLARAAVRPYLALRAALGEKAAGASGDTHCPFCRGRPQISIRRATPDSDGAQRLLGCALCGGEWPIGRIRCAACGEDDPARLPIFGGDLHPNARIEACDACGAYLKSIDLTQDARPIPEIDDLLSISLDLWAADRGYSRIEPGLAGAVTP